MNEVRKPRDNDILLGRGNGTAAWIGNVNFRKIIWKHRLVYQSAGRYDKMVIANKVYEKLSQLHPPARFLRMNDRGTYSEICHDRAIEKICQALREKHMKPPIGADEDSDVDLQLNDRTSKRMSSRNAKKKNKKTKQKDGMVGTNRVIDKTKVAAKKKRGKSAKFDRHTRHSRYRDDKPKSTMKPICSTSMMVSPITLNNTRNSKKVVAVKREPQVEHSRLSQESATKNVHSSARQEGMTLNREVIMTMSRHVPSSMRSVDGYACSYEGIRNYETNHRSNLELSMRSNRSHVRIDTSTSPYEYRIRELALRAQRHVEENWDGDDDDDDEAVAGTLINFDEYDFTFTDPEAEQRSFHRQPHRTLSDRDFNHNKEPLRTTVVRPQWYPMKVPRFKSGNGGAFHSSAEHLCRENKDVGFKTEQGCLTGPIPTPESPKVACRMITPTQEDHYPDDDDDTNETESILSSDNIVLYHETPTKIAATPIGNNLMIPSARRFQPGQQMVSGMYRMHQPVASSTPAYQPTAARVDPGQYDNIFDEDHEDGDYENEWNSRLAFV